MSVLANRSCKSSQAGFGARSKSERQPFARVVASSASPRPDAAAPHGAASDLSPTRRALLLSTLAGVPAALLLAPQPASADLLKDALRGFTRPDVSVKDAVVILLDAKSTLKDIQGIAATPSDSEERFSARAFWPAYALRLRAVAEAAPVVAGLVTGAADKEETLSEYYGGKATSGAGVADAVYQGLGRVLTISGRTIRPEAQASPEAAAGAEQAIDSFLQKVPAALLDEARQFRVERAKAAGRGGEGRGL